GGYNLRELRNRNPKFHSGNRPNLFYPFYVNPNISENGYCAAGIKRDENYYIEVRPFNSTGKESVWRWGVPKATQNIIIDDLDKSQILAKQKKDGNWNIYEKNRKSTSKVKSLWDETEMRTEEGTRELRSLFGETYFDHPKPVELIKRCSLIGSNQDDIILDFFSGSGTTAQSVFTLNTENAEEQRTWILIQLPEQLKEDHSAYKNGGFKTIGMERMRRAAYKIKAEKGADIDYGFKHYTLVEPSEDTLDKLEEFKAGEIFTNNDTLSLFGKETVLETWLVKDGYGFGAKVQEVKLANYTAYLYGKHLYFIEAGIDENDMVALLDKYQQESAFSPENIVV
ncbi:site-specific DNA-methyltransferase, partial [bacterium]|nr:site-specific DNA-methyltransferase [bacterium]